MKNEVKHELEYKDELHNSILFTQVTIQYIVNPEDIKAILQSFATLNHRKVMRRLEMSV